MFQCSYLIREFHQLFNLHYWNSLSICLVFVVCLKIYTEYTKRSKTQYQTYMVRKSLVSLTRKAIQLPIQMAENFLYNSKGLDVISLLVKYYVPLAHFNKVINRDGGKWWSKDYHLVVIKILKNVDFSLKNVKTGERKL